MPGSTKLAQYKASSGNEITLSYDTIRNVICDNTQVTDQECNFFAALCKSYKIDPFVKEAYLIKYGEKPAQMVVGKDYWMKQAGKHPQFDGIESGVSIAKRDANGQVVIERREGSMVGGKTEKLVGGWARVHRKDRKYPVFDEVSFDEYSTGMSMWKPASQGGKPATMIRKVAIVHALREAFPECFSGLYDSSEMGNDQRVETIEEPPIQVQAEFVEQDPPADEMPPYEDMVDVPAEYYEEESESF